MIMMKNTFVRAALLVVGIASAAALVPLMGSVGVVARGGPGSESSPREIQLVVRDMTYYVDGQDEPNPTLQARPGERIRLILRNTDGGMSHDFTIQEWKVRTRVLKGKGQAAVEFTVPEALGSHEYRCTPHAAMMSGTIVVR
jgi:plastocyanin